MTDIQKYVSPWGRSLFAHVFKPSTYVPVGGQPKKGDKGKYQISLVLDPDKHRPWLADLRAAIQACAEEYAASLSTTKKPVTAVPNINPERTHLNKDKEETGNILLRFSLTAGGIGNDGEPWSRSCLIFDLDGNPTKLEAEIGNDSTIRVSFALKPFFNSSKGATDVSMQIRGIQVGKLTQAFNVGDDFGAIDADEMAQVDGSDGNESTDY